MPYLDNAKRIVCGLYILVKHADREGGVIRVQPTDTGLHAIRCVGKKEFSDEELARPLVLKGWYIHPKRKGWHIRL